MAPTPNGNGNGNGNAPMFSTNWFKAVTTIGVPAIIALGFSYWITNQVIENQKTIITQTQLIAQQVEWLRQSTQAHNEVEVDFIAEVVFALRRNCLLFSRANNRDPTQCVPEKSLDVPRLFPSDDQPPTPNSRRFDR